MPINSADQLTPWVKGDAFKASHLNEVNDYLRQRGEVTTERGLDGHSQGVFASRGTLIGKPRDELTGRWFWAKIVGNGPQGSKDPDFTDNRYWVQAEYMLRSGDLTSTIVFRDDSSIYGLIDASGGGTSGTSGSETIKYLSVTRAANIAEAKDATHYLQFGQFVRVYEVHERASDFDPSKPGNTTQAIYRWVFFCPDPGRGQYPGQVLLTEAANTRQWSFITAVPSLT